MNAHIDSLTPPRIVELALAIDRRADTSALQGALEIGKLIIHGLYGGNLAAWRARGRKDTSFRQLARVTRLSASVLYRSAALYELSCRMDIVRWGLPMCHLRAVLGLPHAEQRRLLQRAHRERWTVRELELACAAIRQAGRTRPVGRPPSPALLKGISRLSRAISVAGQAPISPDALTPQQRRRALADLDEQLRQLSAIRHRLVSIPEGTTDGSDPGRTRSSA